MFVSILCFNTEVTGCTINHKQPYLVRAVLKSLLFMMCRLADQNKISFTSNHYHFKLKLYINFGLMMKFIHYWIKQQFYFTLSHVNHVTCSTRYRTHHRLDESARRNYVQQIDPSFLMHITIHIEGSASGPLMRKRRIRP